tara:strand:- start:8055 stop:8504 length:450 start_codon:yes stop_codon:yes gene_type:complete
LKRFVFAYQSVLEARVAEEENAKQAIATIVKRRNALERGLVEHRGFLEANRSQARTELVGKVDIDTLRAHAGQSVQVMRRIRALLAEMAEVHGALDTARDAWRACRQRRKGIECLRDRARKTWDRDCRRAERRAQDDLVATRASRELQT